MVCIFTQQRLIERRGVLAGGSRHERAYGVEDLGQGGLSVSTPPPVQKPNI